MRRLTLLALLVTAALSALALGIHAPPTIRLDHVPIAVHDLDAAVLNWRDVLGFAIKPGRPHANTVDNAHVKFPDGTSLELITAARAVDDLAREYLAFLEGGEGPAFLALHGGDAEEVEARTRTTGEPYDVTRLAYGGWLSFADEGPLGYLFLSWITSPPVDLPEHHAHANTAYRLAAVWLEKDSFAAEERLLAAFGTAAAGAEVALPGGRVAREVRLAGGSLYLIHDAGATRPIRGVTVAVRDLDRARTVVKARGIASGSDPRGRWLRIPPSAANGTWLELLEPAR